MTSTLLIELLGIKPSASNASFSHEPFVNLYSKFFPTLNLIDFVQVESLTLTSLTALGFQLPNSESLPTINTDSLSFTSVEVMTKAISHVLDCVGRRLKKKTNKTK